MKITLTSICLLLSAILSGCATKNVYFNENNTFYSSNWPSLKLSVADDFTYIGHKQWNYDNVLYGSGKVIDHYVYVAQDPFRAIVLIYEKFIGGRAIWIKPDMSNTNNAIFFESIDLTNKKYVQYIEVGTFTGDNRIYVEHGIKKPIFGIHFIVSRILDSDKKNKITIGYTEGMENFNRSVYGNIDWRNKGWERSGNYNDTMEKNIRDFKERAVKSLPIESLTKKDKEIINLRIENTD